MSMTNNLESLLRRMVQESRFTRKLPQRTGIKRKPDRERPQFFIVENRNGKQAVDND